MASPYAARPWLAHYNLPAEAPELSAVLVPGWPRDALRTSRMRLREVNWLGDGTIESALCAGWHEVFVKVRSTRPPHPAWLSRGAHGIEVDLVVGEDGVSPGQACVFYDAPDGQARVLGGGIIKSAVAANEAAPPREPQLSTRVAG